MLLLQAHLRVRLSAGRVDEAVRTGRHAYAVQSGLADRWTAYYPARSLYLVAAALLESGRLDEAERTALEGQEAMRDAVPALTVWFAWVRGRIALERGLVTDALAHFREARALARLCGQHFAEQRAWRPRPRRRPDGPHRPEAESLAPSAHPWTEPWHPPRNPERGAAVRPCGEGSTAARTSGVRGCRLPVWGGSTAARTSGVRGCRLPVWGRVDGRPDIGSAGLPPARVGRGRRPPGHRECGAAARPCAGGVDGCPGTRSAGAAVRPRAAPAVGRPGARRAGVPPVPAPGAPSASPTPSAPTAGCSCCAGRRVPRGS
ncbi:tetratricopeptide repeat protein [Streptomyces diastatochromogenes]|nr:tetratricopeptide repeat protein [Streptomyces diastatochromogenes]